MTTCMTKSVTRTTATRTLRRSARLQRIVALSSANGNKSDPTFRSPSQSSCRKLTKISKRQRQNKPVKEILSKKNEGNAISQPSPQKEISCLPRDEENRILSSQSSSSDVRFVLGIDEAGRGPLAGPVVAAAAMVPIDIDGITDSKKINKEDDREYLYEAIIESRNVKWAVAVMDAPCIDRVNILQATMEAMSAAATALITGSSVRNLDDEVIPKISTPTIEQKGCYVVTNNAVANFPADNFFALVDGNRIPTNMPCKSKAIVKGDSKEYAIAAASILAKVTRDRLMRGYHELWPQYGLHQHKGYPTAAHMQAVSTHGATPIHRRTFRPLKDMSFDEGGKVI